MHQEIEQLVREAQRGDAKAFARLIERLERSALAVAYAVCGDADRAADAVQEAFIRAWTRLSSLREPERFGAWLSNIVRNASADMLRRRRDAGGDGELARLASQLPAVLDEMAERERRDHLERALAQLDEVSRCAVVLRYYDGLSSRQIGAFLELSPAAIDMRLMRARLELRKLLAGNEAFERMKT